MPRAKAILITQHNNRRQIPIREAKAMLRHGQAERVSDRPLVVKMLIFPTYDEELRYLSGLRVEGVHRGRWAGKYNISSSQRRCRPPRKAIRADEQEQEFRRNKRLYLNRLEDKRWDAA